MKKIIALGLLALLAASCARKEGSNPSASADRIEITPMIVNKVVFKDTLLINRAYKQTDSTKGKEWPVPDLYDGNPALFLDAKAFERLKSAIGIMVNDPKSKVFLGLNGAKPDWNKPADKMAARGRLVLCDSIEEISYDASGSEVSKSRWMCDSLSITEGITEIYFYEAWYFNKQNNMIERDVLGYSFFQYVESKQAFRQLFYVFRDQEALERAKKYYSEL